MVLNYYGEALRPSAEALASEAEARGVRTVLVDGDVTIDADCRRIAAEAVEDLQVWIDVKTRRFLLVKRTAGHPVRAGRPETCQGLV